jgi:hypothetical protein
MEAAFRVYRLSEAGTNPKFISLLPALLRLGKMDGYF